jgi:hypothetical protein
MGFKKGSIGAILMEDLNSLRNDREVLINELKDQYPSSKDLEFITRTITTYNAIIKELEHIIDKAKLAGKSE